MNVGVNVTPQYVLRVPLRGAKVEEPPYSFRAAVIRPAPRIVPWSVLRYGPAGATVRRTSGGAGGRGILVDPAVVRKSLPAT